MASSTFYKMGGAKELQVIQLFVHAAIGSTGAVTLNTAKSKGIASMTRTSAGLYVITLSEAYAELLAVDGLALFSTLQDLTFQVNAETVATTKTITMWCKTAATATDPTSGTTLKFKITLKNSGV